MQTKPTTPIPAPRSDPYRDWLGITTPERPPNHYQLLGLSEFESDIAKISAAFENRFGNVRRYQVGARTEEAVQLLQRLSTAYAELCDSRRKSEYDATLRRPIASAENETVHDVRVTVSDTGKTERVRPPQLPTRAALASADPEKDIADGEFVPDEPTTGDAEKIVELESWSGEPAAEIEVVPLEAAEELKQAGDAEASTGSPAAADVQLGSSIQVPTAERADSTPAVVPSFKSRRAKAKRRKALKSSLARYRSDAAQDPDRISPAERLQVSVLALFAVFPIVLVGLLLVFVAPVALVLVSAYNLVAWLALCVLWFLRGGWRTVVGSVIRAIVHVDRMIGVALGEDNHIVHNFVRVIILIVVLTAGLALLASGSGIFL